MSTRQNIIDYLRRKSGGMINITNEMATDIVSLVRNVPIEKTAHAKLYRWNMAKHTYELQYCIQSSDELVKWNVQQALTKPPVNDFYLWECYNSDGQFEGKIYTVDTNLF